MTRYHGHCEPRAAVWREAIHLFSFSIFNVSAMNIGIIGLGFLGGALKRYFEQKKGYRLFFYDTGKQIGSPEEINRADIIFVCVNTPYSATRKQMDASFVESSLRSILPGKIVIIRSTVIPGTMARLQKHFPRLKLLLNPEFLREKFSNQDFLQPPMQIIGYTKQSKPHAKKILLLLPRSSHQTIMTAETAEFIKYFVNAFLAMKVSFANIFWEACQKTGADYRALQNAIAAEPRIGPSHLNIWYEGFRGYSGACLPKDAKSIIAVFKKLRIDPSFLKAMDKYNDRLLKKQKIKINLGYPRKSFT
jgi:UDPglucose 6-dehydrogenase